MVDQHVPGPVEYFFLQDGVWHKGSARSLDKSKVCLITAIESCYRITDTSVSKMDSVRAAIKALFPIRAVEVRGVTRIIPFNDDPRTTIEDIRAVCHKAGV